MSASEWVYALHWVIYIFSFIAFALLFTRYRKWGAAWIAVLFLTQAIFNGCLIVDWQNYYRVHEGLLPIMNGQLTERFSSLVWVQTLLSSSVAAASALLAVI